MSPKKPHRTLFQEGNQLQKKLTTSELKAEAYRQYCEWIASGMSKKAWEFQHPEISLTWETMEKYIKESPTDFDPIHKQIAEARSLALYEKKGLEMMEGKVKGCQPAIYQMFMRNKFGWDKEGPPKQTNETQLDVFMRFIEQHKQEES